MSRVDEEHIREIRRHQSQIRASKRSPFIEDDCAFGTTNIDLSHATGDSVEAGGQDDDIEFVFNAVRRPNPFRGNLGYPVLIDVNEADVRLIENVVVILEIRISSSRVGHMLDGSNLLQKRAFCCVWIWFDSGSKLFLQPGVVDTRSDLVPPERIYPVVRVIVRVNFPEST